MLGDCQDWCGRCGTVGFIGHISTSDDLGYCGCPNDRDPSWSRYDKGPGFQSIIDGGKIRSQLTAEEMCDRWDRQHFPDCSGCGHPWGLHKYGGLCSQYCGCDCYEAPVSTEKLIDPSERMIV